MATNASTRGGRSNTKGLGTLANHCIFRGIMISRISKIIKGLKRQGDLEQREQYFIALLEQNLPQQLHYSESIKQMVRALIKAQFGLSGFSETVHKSDIMFHYHLLQVKGEMIPALFSHFAVGARFANSLKDLMAELQDEPDSILDFGSGYGRVSRFLPLIWPLAEVSVSEVKEEAMDFQHEEFGFKSIKHGQNPQSFKAGQYDLIIALSVFSHLPQEAFEAWFERLLDHLSKRGKLIFSFNSLDKPKKNQSFKFVPNSEDLHFPHITNANLNPVEYGHAYISRELISSLAHRHQVQAQFLGTRLSPQQECVMITRKA